MPRGYRLYLEDILEAVESIQSYADTLSYEELIKDKMRVDAIVRNFEIIGEAAGKIPCEVRDKYHSLEWRKICDFRNILVHEYFEIDLEILWDIIKNKLPELKKHIKLMIGNMQ